MGSRRTMTRSSSGNGRSSNGGDISGSSRPGSCSYLSNVRPENRNTLCSIIAQLTEETQPFFETTLKSKAVSENCNVKFSCVVTGHPVPQVIWYKDDVQLDRYCGLPKYEIFRNGGNHSLHIYGCTVEDAAIYQASAINTKGIVSCSGVLEVGEMNEFKIHQRYFAKVKQKAENRRREAEGKENQEPLRTISPDRMQRKRRSTMEAFLSTPSSMEDDANEESQQVVAVETEARLQEATAEEGKEQPVPLTNGAPPALTNGQAFSENANKSATHVCDAAQKTFNAHQPKTPYVKKKIKISNGGRVAKSEAPREWATEDRRAKDETSTSVALACTKSEQFGGNSEEGMEVENNVSSLVVDSGSRNGIEYQKSEGQEVLLVEKRSNDEKRSVEVIKPPEKEKLTALLPSAVPPISTGYNVSGTEGKQAAKHRKEAKYTAAVRNLKTQSESPHLASTKLKTRAAAASQQTPSVTRRPISTTGDVTAMAVDVKSNASTGASSAHRDPVNTPCESRTVSPRRPCEQAGSQLPESPCQKTVSVSGPASLSEVAQVHTKMSRTDAPVSLERPLDQCATDAQPPEKTPSERRTSMGDTQTTSLDRGLQAAIDKMTQESRDHSLGSNEIHTVLFTDLQVSPLQSRGGGESTLGCNISPSNQQSQVDRPIKTDEGTEIQVVENVEDQEVGKLIVVSDTMGRNEKIVEMEIENAALHIIEHSGGEKSKDGADKDAGVIIVDACNKESEENEYNNEQVLKMEEETDPVLPLLTITPENTNLAKPQTEDFQEVKQSEAKIISIAELLRAQIKALESTLTNSGTIIPVHADFVQEPDTTSTEASEEFKDDDSKSKLEVKKPKPDRKIDGTPRNIKEMLMEVYDLLYKMDQEHIRRTRAPTSPPVQALENPIVIPPTSVVETDTTEESARLHGRAKNHNDGVNCQETQAANLVPTCQEPGTLPTVTPIKASGEDSNIAVLDNTKDEPDTDKETGFNQTPEITLHCTNKTETTETLLDQNETEKNNQKDSCLETAHTCPTEPEPGTEIQGSTPHLQQDSSTVKEFSKTDTLAKPILETSPLLKKKNGIAPIPSATAQELASGARRKITIPKVKPEEASGATSPVDPETQKREISASPVTLSPSPSLSRRSPLLQPPSEQTSPTERHSPLVNRRKVTSETLAPSWQPTGEIHTIKTEGKPAEKVKHDPFKAPQVIRKIRAETFADATGHLKLWCQFFNVLSDSTIKWYRNEEEIAQTKRTAGDESQASLAIVQASSKDSGVYRCTITNEYGTDSTDCLLSAEIMGGMSLREDLGVGEEIEMTPMIFNKGVADSGAWGNKLFGRIMMQESQIGDGCSHKVWRAKVIYGLEPVFESGNTCIIKARNPITYGGKGESLLIDRNLEMIKQECKIQNLVREYCKIFSAEARVIESFGPTLEVIPVHLMYRPANTVPYATVEADLGGDYQKYCVLDHMRTGSEVEQKFCALEHWMFQWTNGNLLLTRLEGVDTKITNVGISVKTTGHQGLSVEGNPKLFEQFVSQHQCNYFCGLLGLKSLKVMDSLLTPTKPKGSKSPLLQRKMASGSSSPQTGRKKAAGSPRLPRKTEQEGGMMPTKQNAADATTIAKME